MPSAIWTGSISFGLVTVPVRLVSATKSLDVRFNQLDADTGARIRYRRVSDATGEEVPSEKIVKGYEIEPGQYVIVEPDEIAALQPKKSRAIDIEDFVDLVRDRPGLLRAALLPDPRQGRGQAVPPARRRDERARQGRGRSLRASVEGGTGRHPAGRRRVAARDHALRRRSARRGSRRARSRSSRPSPSERELEMARQLVNALAGRFDPDKYHDEYREELHGPHRAQGRGGGDRRVDGARGAREGARPDGRARSQPGPHRRQDEASRCAPIVRRRNRLGARKAAKRAPAKKAAAPRKAASEKKAPAKRDPQVRLSGARRRRAAGLREPYERRRTRCEALGQVICGRRRRTGVTMASISTAWSSSSQPHEHTRRSSWLGRNSVHASNVTVMTCVSEP